MKVDVLGTPYNFVDESDYLEAHNADGVTFFYRKSIGIRNFDDLLCPDDPPEAKEVRRKEVIRHEIIHAFFHESGLYQYGDDELLVTWLAIQFPKMLDAFVAAQSIERPTIERFLEVFKHFENTGGGVDG